MAKQQIGEKLEIVDEEPHCTHHSGDESGSSSNSNSTDDIGYFNTNNCDPLHLHPENRDGISPISNAGGFGRGRRRYYGSTSTNSSPRSSPEPLHSPTPFPYMLTTNNQTSCSGSSSTSNPSPRHQYRFPGSPRSSNNPFLQPINPDHDHDHDHDHNHNHNHDHDHDRTPSPSHCPPPSSSSLNPSPTSPPSQEDLPPSQSQEEEPDPKHPSHHQLAPSTPSTPSNPSPIYRVHSSSKSALHNPPLSGWKSLALCAFTGLGGILFGYDTGYINGVMAMPYFENLYLGYSLRPEVVAVTDRDGEKILDKKGQEIYGPISINALRVRLPLNDSLIEWSGGVVRGAGGLGGLGLGGQDGGEGEGQEKNLLMEAFRYEDSQPPPWIRIERHEQPFFLGPPGKQHHHYHHWHAGSPLPGTVGSGTKKAGVWGMRTAEDSDDEGGDDEDREQPQPVWFRLPARDKSLIVGLLSAGTCIGSLLGSDAADYLGRRVALMVACVVFIWGVVNQTVSEHMDLLGRGRFETGLGMGMVSTVIVLYMCEISPAPLRGILVAWYQLCITLGLLISACVNLGTRDMWNTGSFRIPISLQIAWACILGVGLFFLPESPRWYVKMGKDDRARDALARLRCQDPHGEVVEQELRGIISNYEVEMEMAPPGSDTFVGSWKNCFRGPWKDRGSNLRRTVLGASVQMFQQVSGVNFIFYYGTAFFKQQRFDNVFVIVVIMSAINVASTILSFWLVNNLRRRTLLISGAVAMGICQIMVATVGLISKMKGHDASGFISSDTVPTSVFWSTMTGVGGYLFFYAITWGPGAWILTGEIFPLQVRARGVGIATSTNWLWNTIISFITPVLVDSDHWNLGPMVFIIWGAGCLVGAFFTFLWVPETKGLTLEQIDIIFEVSARRSSAYIPAEGQEAEAEEHQEAVPPNSERRFSEFSMFKFPSSRRVSSVTAV